MKKKNKKVEKKNKVIPVVIISLLVVLAISATLLIYIYTQNYIVIENVSKSSDTEKAASVSPIIVNNMVIGGVTNNGKFTNEKLATSRMSINDDTEIDMYKQTGKMGTYKVTSTGRLDNKLVYVIPFKDITNIEYIALLKGNNNIMQRETVKLEKTDKDEKYVKKALGKYRLFNNTVKVNEVYEMYLTTEEKTRIICATSKGDTTFGAYSCIIAVNGSKAKIIKYAYVKNTESSVNWPIYSLSFACDLNNDDVYELIVQETKENDVKYSVIQYKRGEFYEVIGTEIELNK